MSRSDKALIVAVATGLAAAGAAYVSWRDRRFMEVARSIDACDPEATVQRKTEALGAPARVDRDAGLVAWRRNGKFLTVAFVTPRSGERVVGTVRVTVNRLDEGSAVLYEDVTGLRHCR